MFKNYIANIGPQAYNVYPGYQGAAASAASSYFPSAAAAASPQLQPSVQLSAPLVNRNVCYGMAPFRVPSLANYPRNATQKLMIVRHAERVDSYYGLNWVENAFAYNGMYCRFDYNMPKELIPRENPYDFEFDPPLTENGLNQARLHGEELARLGIRITHCYSSPALRSIQTADKILEGMCLKDKVPIRIEIGLFELLSWQSYLPCRYPFIDKHTLRAYGYNVDLNYEPILNYENLKPDETINDYYFRSHYVTKIITDAHLMDGGNLMFVGHAPSLEGCSRQLIGEPVRNFDEFLFINRQITFLSMAQCERNLLTGKWELTPIRGTAAAAAAVANVASMGIGDVCSNPNCITNAPPTGEMMGEESCCMRAASPPVAPPPPQPNDYTNAAAVMAGNVAAGAAPNPAYMSPYQPNCHHHHHHSHHSHHHRTHHHHHPQQQQQQQQQQCMYQSDPYQCYYG